MLQQKRDQPGHTDHDNENEKSHPWKEVTGSLLLKSDDSGHTPIIHDTSFPWDEAESKMPRGLVIWDVPLMALRENQQAKQRIKHTSERILDYL